MITELLQRFIQKAETHSIGQPFRGSPTEIVDGSLGTRTYHGLDIKASFGQGLATAVPWIGFFAFEQKTEKGIYPVFLYFKEQRRLVLAYGVSETHPPDLPKPVRPIATPNPYVYTTLSFLRNPKGDRIDTFPSEHIRRIKQLPS